MDAFSQSSFFLLKVNLFLHLSRQQCFICIFSHLFKRTFDALSWMLFIYIYTDILLPWQYIVLKTVH